MFALIYALMGALNSDASKTVRNIRCLITYNVELTIGEKTRAKMVSQYIYVLKLYYKKNESLLSKYTKLSKHTLLQVGFY